MSAIFECCHPMGPLGKARGCWVYGKALSLATHPMQDPDAVECLELCLLGDMGKVCHRFHQILLVALMTWRGNCGVVQGSIFEFGVDMMKEPSNRGDPGEWQICDCSSRIEKEGRLKPCTKLCPFDTADLEELSLRSLGPQIADQELKLGNALLHIQVPQSDAAISRGSICDASMYGPTKSHFCQECCTGGRFLDAFQILMTMSHEGQTIQYFWEKAQEVSHSRVLFGEATREKPSDIGFDMCCDLLNDDAVLKSADK
eukprot:scaffold3330_cov110-Cylindrotheca_fusiformis.AAC.1